MTPKVFEIMVMFVSDFTCWIFDYPGLQHWVIISIVAGVDK